MNKKTKKTASGNHLKQDISMMCLIANENTSGSRKLLKKLGKTDAKNHDDLELALAKLYKDSADKLIIEKEFAEIHPHKKFILKYCEAKQDKDKEITPEKIEVQKKTVQDLADIDPAPAEMIYSNCCGASGASGQTSCACGGASSFNGNNNGSGSGESSQNIIMFGMVAIVSIFGLIVYLKK
tara:strand:- start:640 stop:1185 length:546 start_codon:yes stop_codon:yes gene_type:complete